jgi:cbb3-type cytochrome oxidase subunit 1
VRPYVRRFIRSSLAWLVVGVSIGVLMALWPRALAYRPAHMHANLLGFVSMMIFGVAYHVLPRFSAAPLHSERLAALHLWLANIGLAGMVVGFVGRAHALPAAGGALAVGAVLSAAGAIVFVFNIWRTLDAAPAPPDELVTIARRKVNA